MSKEEPNKRLAPLLPLGQENKLSTDISPSNILMRRQSTGRMYYNSFDTSRDIKSDDFVFGVGVGLSSKQVRELFPFHVAVDRDFNIIQLGSKLSTYLRGQALSKGPIYQHVSEFFRISSPTSCLWDWKSLTQNQNSSFELELLVRDSKLPHNPQRTNRFCLIGGLSIFDPKEDSETGKFSAVFLVSPNVRNNEDLVSHDLRLADLSMHSFHRDVIQLEEQLQSTVQTMYNFDEQNKQLRIENERLMAEVQANQQNDMRHMIANVAHDLKTPLAAFLSGIEFVSNEIASTEGKIKSREADMRYVSESLSAIKGSVMDVKDINQFMIMTINRCIDYTKASQGLKLVPKLDTMHLIDTLKLPLNCMTDLQKKLSIHLKDVSEDICSHIITDKQWLQENILCLLSNATKYSYHGVIELSITLKGAIETIASTKQTAYIQHQRTNRIRSISNSSGGLSNSNHGKENKDHQPASRSTTINEGTSLHNPFPLIQATSSHDHSEDSSNASSGKAHSADEALKSSPEYAEEGQGGLRLRSMTTEIEPSEDTHGPGVSMKSSKSNKSFYDNTNNISGSAKNNNAFVNDSFSNKILGSDSHSNKFGGNDSFSSKSSKLGIDTFSAKSTSPRPVLGPLTIAGGSGAVPGGIAVQNRVSPPTVDTIMTAGLTTSHRSSRASPIHNRDHTNCASPGHSSPQSSHHSVHALTSLTGSPIHQRGSTASKSFLANHSAVHTPTGGNRNVSPQGSMQMNSNNKLLTKALNAAAEKMQREDETLQPLLMVEVEDTGIGLSDQEMDNLFSPFSQAQRLAGGTGLGLYSLAKRMEALNGYYGVERRRDGHQGSLFWFAIPYRPDQDASVSDAAAIAANLFTQQLADLAPLLHPDSSRSGGSAGSLNLSTDNDSQEAGDVAVPLPLTTRDQRSASSAASPHSSRKNGSASSASSKSPSHRRKYSSDGLNHNASMESIETTDLSRPKHTHITTGLNVLIADDAISILKMTSMMLRREGHSVDQAENGAEALEKIEEHLNITNRAYDVVLIDLQMPVIDGLEATRRLRAIEMKAYNAHHDRLHQDSKDSNEGEKEGEEEESDSLKLQRQNSDFSSSSELAAFTRAKLPPIHQIVIGVSAQDDEETTLSAFDAGVDGFMCKPFSLKTFLETVESVRAAIGLAATEQHLEQQVTTSAQLEAAELIACL